jgi:hypothetical protein
VWSLTATDLNAGRQDRCNVGEKANVRLSAGLLNASPTGVDNHPDSFKHEVFEFLASSQNIISPHVRWREK